MFHVKQFSTKKGPRRASKRGLSPFFWLLFSSLNFRIDFTYAKRGLPKMFHVKQFFHRFEYSKRGLKIGLTPFSDPSFPFLPLIRIEYEEKQGENSQDPQSRMDFPCSSGDYLEKWVENETPGHTNPYIIGKTH